MTLLHTLCISAAFLASVDGQISNTCATSFASATKCRALAYSATPACSLACARGGVGFSVTGSGPTLSISASPVDSTARASDGSICSCSTQTAAGSYSSAARVGFTWASGNLNVTLLGAGASLTVSERFVSNGSVACVESYSVTGGSCFGSLPVLPIAAIVGLGTSAIIGIVVALVICCIVLPLALFVACCGCAVCGCAACVAAGNKAPVSSAPQVIVMSPMNAAPMAQQTQA